MLVFLFQTANIAKKCVLASFLKCFTDRIGQIGTDHDLSNKENSRAIARF